MSEHRSFHLTSASGGNDESSGSSNASSRTIWLLVSTMLAILIVPYVCCWLWSWCEFRYERKLAVTLLSAGHSDEDFVKACGEKGVFVRINESEWIAIRYKDVHSAAGWSLATALDSDGKWWQSTHHHCARFAAYKRLCEELTAETDPEILEIAKMELEIFPALEAISKSSSLADATPHLCSLKFDEVIR